MARHLLLGSVILLGAALRFHALGAKSLWGDEINTTVNFVLKPAWEIITHLDPNNHLLYSLLAHLFTLEGANEFLLRAPAALLGIAAIPALYRLGQAVASPGVGLVAALLLAISPYHLGYSQEARGYSALALFTTLSLLYLLQATRVRERRHFAAFGVATVLALYSHLFAALPIGAALCLLVGYVLADLLTGRPLRFPLSAWAVTLLLTALTITVLYAPLWLAWLGLIDRSQIGDYAGRLGFATDWMGLASVVDLGRRFGGGWGGQWQPVAVISFAFFSIGLVSTIGRSRPSTILASVLVLPFLFVALISRLWAGFYIYSRFFIFALPVCLVFVACGLAWVAQGVCTLEHSRVGQRVANAMGRCLGAHPPTWAISFALAVGLLGTTGLPALSHYYATERQDWRGVGQYLLRNVGPGDRVVQLWLLQPNSLAWYYRPTDPTIRVLQASTLRPDSSDFTDSDVWWVIVHDGHLDRLRREAGSELDVVGFAWLAIVHARSAISSSVDAMHSTITLLEIQRDLTLTDRLAYQKLIDHLVGGSGYDLARHYLDHGDAQAAASEWAVAARSYERAVQAWPDWGMAHTRLGNAYRAQGQLDTAETEYRRSIEVEPGYVGAYLNLGGLYETQGRQAEAMSLYQAALEVAPGSAWAHASLGNALLQRGNPDDGLAHLEQAVVLEPATARWFLVLAQAYQAVGRRDEAIAAYRQVLALDPANQPAAEALQALVP